MIEEKTSTLKEETPLIKTSTVFSANKLRKKLQDFYKGYVFKPKRKIH